MQNALIGIDASEKDRLGAEISQNAVEWRIPESADAIFVDLDVMRLLLKLVDDSGGPGVLFQHMRAAARQWIAQSNARAMRLVEMNLIGRHVRQIGSIAPIHPDDRDTCLTQ